MDIPPFVPRKHNKVNENQVITETLQIILTLLSSPKIPANLIREDFLNDYPDFKKICDTIKDVRDLSAALSVGELHKFFYSKGYILSNLKGLQSNLRHLTYQAQKVAEGDFTQKVDFLGDFSAAFNEMIIKLRESSVKLTRLANVDALTQIPNRLALEQFLVESYKLVKSAGKKLSIMICDIDFFKSVNDTYGHDAGDAVLIKVSSVLSNQFRGSDMFGRYGGEEFMGVLPNTDVQIAEKVASRALDALRTTPIIVSESVTLHKTVSIGVSMSMPDDTGYEDIVKRSDEALYMAKETGRNKVCVYSKK
ncbi:MAG: GGDEF domain-containing protein [Clostridiales bacterium]|jgi:diguanylate cyclase (GGDEF)-like protein|nr:GGDEF domain-containing protein [Clostridiales bacterium]